MGGRTAIGGLLRVGLRAAGLAAVLLQVPRLGASPGVQARRPQPAKSDLLHGKHGPIGPLYGTIRFRWTVNDQNSGTDTTPEGQEVADWKETYQAAVEVVVAIQGKAGEQRGKATDRLQVIYSAGSATASCEEHYHLDITPRQNADEDPPSWEDLQVRSGRGPAAFGATAAGSRCSARWQGGLVVLDCLVNGMTARHQRSNSRTGTEPEAELPWAIQLPGSSQEGPAAIGQLRVRPEIRGETLRLHQTFQEDTIGRWQSSHALATVQNPVSQHQYERALWAMPPQYADAMRQALERTSAAASQQQAARPQRGKQRFGPGGPWEGRMTVSVDLTTAMLEADPGGPYQVERAGWVTLDGSRSKGEIDAWEWTFEPDAGDQESAPANRAPGASAKVSKKTGKRVKAQILGGVTVTLTVRSKGRSDSKQVRIEADPRRSFLTRVQYRADWNHPTPWLPPYAWWSGPDRTAARMVGKDGENVCARDHLGAEAASGVLHPHGNRMNGTWLGHGYQVEQVADPDGPFDRDYYVVSSELIADRAGIFNQALKLDAPPPYGADVNMAAANRRKGIDWQGYLDATDRHEGWGTGGNERSGHTALMKNFLAGRDPQKEIERLHKSSRAELEKAANEVINSIDQELARLAGDSPPLTGNWRGPYFIYFKDWKAWDRVSEEF